MALSSGVCQFGSVEDYKNSLLYFYRGLITLVIGVATFWRMPASPTQSKTWFRPKGWFTEREETIVVTRVLRDDPTKVTTITLALN